MAKKMTVSEISIALGIEVEVVAEKKPIIETSQIIGGIRLSIRKQYCTFPIRISIIGNYSFGKTDIGDPCPGDIMSIAEVEALIINLQKLVDIVGKS